LCFLPWQQVGTTTKKEKESKRRKRKEKEDGDSKNVELHGTIAMSSKFFCTFFKLAWCSRGLQGSKEAWENGALGAPVWGLFFFMFFQT
jgi:hypothetical protein